MSSSEITNEEVSISTEVIFTNEIESSEDPPMEEWSSLNFEPIEIEQVSRDPGSGEICAKYIPLSDSSVFRHPYYKYPAVPDPGIKEALLHPEPRVIYPDDGQELYLALCKEMEICPIRSYHRQLLEEVINLKYYGINPMGFRAIALSLKGNRIVTVLDLTDNWISEDGCFHLGEMFIENITLRELNLCGCRIGPEGARRLFANLHLNRTLRKLDISKNKLGDAGVEFLATALYMGAEVRDINLSYNELTTKAVTALNESFEANNKLTHLNLSWNSILSPNVIHTLCSRFSENDSFEELDLSWNSIGGIRVGDAIRKLMNNQNVRKIILNNNKMSTPTVKPLTEGLRKAKGLVTLDLSFNPFTPEDAFRLLSAFRKKAVKLQNLMLDNVSVRENFVKDLDEIRLLKFRKNTVVSYGDVIREFVPKSVDLRQIAFDRAEAICKKSKKRHVDIALAILKLHKSNKEPLDVRMFTRQLKDMGAILDSDLLDLLVSFFEGPVVQNSKTIDLAKMADYLQRKWPDRKLPPTPPPEPVIVEEPKKAKKTKAGKKK